LHESGFVTAARDAAVAAKKYLALLSPTSDHRADGGLDVAQAAALSGLTGPNGPEM